MNDVPRTWSDGDRNPGTTEPGLRVVDRYGNEWVAVDGEWRYEYGSARVVQTWERLTTSCGPIAEVFVSGGSDKPWEPSTAFDSRGEDVTYEFSDERWGGRRG